ncbi:hypothetical protein OIV83_004464 [Microbotryomycetes sp. JL201]|nr:hypothetical protein OIV83_004464 [Microbotryomycetes sp. JL201]
MVNITYGLLQATSAAIDGTETYSINPSGTDLIATTSDGAVAAYDPGDLIMIPGLGYLYSGVQASRHWYIWGYSLAFSPGGNSFIGDSRYFLLRGVLEQPVPQANNKVPEVVYMIYQQMFASLVPAIFIGAAAERGRVLPALIFTFCWATIVYCPVARWVWAPQGWAFQLGVLDYAGGGPIETLSGATGLAYSIFLGKRRGWGTHVLSFKPHNVSSVVLGTVMLWFGWLGFNGGSTFAANLKAAMAITCTNMAASMGGLTWMLLDYRLERKWSAVGFCTGAICGLVAITPAAGYVSVHAAILIGVLAAGISNLLTALKGFFAFDDAMDIYACHGVAGIVGLVFTGVFAEASVTANDAYSAISGGWVDRNFIVVGYQFAWFCACFGWSFVMTLILMFLINLIPGCKFRTDEESEIVGVDDVECGEWAYDFVHIRRDVESTAGFHSHPPRNSEAAQVQKLVEANRNGHSEPKTEKQPSVVQAVEA